MHHLSYRMHCLVRVDKGHAHSAVHCNPACTPYTIAVNTGYTTHNTAETENAVWAHEKTSTAAMLAAEGILPVVVKSVTEASAVTRDIDSVVFYCPIWIFCFLEYDSLS